MVSAMNELLVTEREITSSELVLLQAVGSSLRESVAGAWPPGRSRQPDLLIISQSFALLCASAS